MAKGGGVQALMLISMVHSVNKETKLLCVQALDNLLDDSTVSFMLDEGLTTSLANLCKIEDPSNRVAHLCAKMFNQLSHYQEAMYRIVERSPVTSAIYSMADSEHVDTAVLCCRTTANLVLCGGPVRQKAVTNGALRVLERGIQLKDSAAAAQCLAALFASSQEPSFLAPMARTSLPLSLVTVARNTRDHAMYANAVKTLALLAHESSSRPFLQTREVATALLDLARSNLLPHAAPWVAYAVRFLSNGYSNSTELVQLDVSGALRALHQVDCGPGSGNAEVAMCAAETLRCISAHSDDCALDMAAAGAETVAVLARAVQTAATGSQSAQTTTALANASHALYNMAFAGSPARVAVALDETVPLICALAQNPASSELAIATIYMFLNDPKTRYTFANEAVCLAIAAIFDTTKSVSCPKSFPPGAQCCSQCRQSIL